MALTEPDNIYSPNRGDTDNISAWSGAMAVSVQAALNDRANSYKGTATQRTAFTADAPVGTLWVDTNAGNLALHIREGSGWTKVWPEEHYDSGVITSFLSSAPGWAVRGGGTSWIRRVNNWVVGYIEVERTGGTINVPNTTGNITNQTLCTLNTNWRPDYSSSQLSGESGRLASFMVNTAGALRMHAVAGTANITNGDVFSARLMYPLKVQDLP